MADKWACFLPHVPRALLQCSSESLKVHGSSNTAVVCTTQSSLLELITSEVCIVVVPVM